MSRVTITPPGSPAASARSAKDAGGAVPGGALPEDDAAVSHDHTLKWVLSDHMDLGETPEPVPEPPPGQPKFVVRETTPTVLRIPTGAKTPPPFNYSLREKPAAPPLTVTKSLAPAVVSTPGSAPPSIPTASPPPAASQAPAAPRISHLLEATPPPVLKQPAAAPPPSSVEAAAPRKTPPPELPQPDLRPPPEEGIARPPVVEAYLDLGATPADFFTADPTPVPGESPADTLAKAAAPVPSPPSGSDAAEISADSLELLPSPLDEKSSAEAPIPVTTGEPDEGPAVATPVSAEAADPQALDAREVEPEAVMMVADSSEQTFDVSARQIQTPAMPTPPPVPPEAVQPTQSRTVAPDTLKHPVPEPSPPPQVLAATLFEEYQTPASAEDNVPEALARRPLQKRSKPWYEEVFDDDYLRTVPFMTPDQTAREVDFIREALALKPSSEVLDVACGYGRHAVELAQQGVRVTGLDLSLPLLIRAADHAQKRGLAVNFVHADMREMTFNGQFDAAYCVLSSFGYFDEETNLKVATGISRALKPGGRFILDIINRDYIVGDLPSRVWWEGDGCVILEEVDFNYHTSRVLIRRSVVFGNGRQSEQEISMRAYSLHEVGRLLRMAGLRVLDVSGSLATKSRFFGAASRNIIALCERHAP